MSKISMDISVWFCGEGQERAPLQVSLTLNAEDPTDEEIAEAVREEVAEHLAANPK